MQSSKIVPSTLLPSIRWRALTDGEAAAAALGHVMVPLVEASGNAVKDMPHLKLAAVDVLVVVVVDEQYDKETIDVKVVVVVVYYIDPLISPLNSCLFLNPSAVTYNAWSGDRFRDCAGFRDSCTDKMRREETGAGAANPGCERRRSAASRRHPRRCYSTHNQIALCWCNCSGGMSLCRVIQNRQDCCTNAGCSRGGA